MLKMSFLDFFSQNQLSNGFLDMINKASESIIMVKGIGRMT